MKRLFKKTINKKISSLILNKNSIPAKDWLDLFNFLTDLNCFLDTGLEVPIDIFKVPYQDFSKISVYRLNTLRIVYDIQDLYKISAVYRGGDIWEIAIIHDEFLVDNNIQGCFTKEIKEIINILKVFISDKTK